MTAGLTHLCRSALVAAGLAITFATAIAALTASIHDAPSVFAAPGCNVVDQNGSAEISCAPSGPENQYTSPADDQLTEQEVSEPGWNG